MADLTDWERDKYRRQIQIEGFGEEAQRKLKASSALVTRVGGLGGPTALYLAVAGIGKLVIAHDGNVTPSNLHRMILVRGDGVGQPRIPQACETLLRANPDCEVVGVAENVSKENVADLVGQVELVCSTTPRFEEKLILNRECWRQGKPMVSSGMNGMEAQLTTILPGRTACLECFVPEVPEWWDPLGFGVIGCVPGALGALTALEAIKVLTGFAEPLAGVLLTFDADDLTFSRFQLGRRPDCPVCGG